MEKERKTIRYDEQLHMEAYRFEGVMRTGFSAQSHFTNYFASFIGLTPGRTGIFSQK